MKMLGFKHDDGGREAAGFKGKTGDCVTRAIAIATGVPYQEVYDALFDRGRELAANGRCKTARRIRSARQGTKASASPRYGVSRKVYQPYLESIGWVWVPTMKIGQGCKVHLRADELPSGRLVVAVSNHLCAVVDGVLHDTYEDTRDGTRCVYGYFQEAVTAVSVQAVAMMNDMFVKFDQPAIASQVDGSIKVDTGEGADKATVIAIMDAVFDALEAFDVDEKGEVVA